ncbi:MAG: hypothetical protein OXN89_11970 [Bryobacterales bacterium]|nr:hypothetical protein [Bryobacterales bacterium]
MSQAKQAAGSRASAVDAHGIDRNILSCYQRLESSIIRENGLVAVERLKVANMTRSAKGTEDEPGSQVAQKARLNRGILSQNW